MGIDGNFNVLCVEPNKRFQSVCRKHYVGLKHRLVTRANVQIYYYYLFVHILETNFSEFTNNFIS